jgi:nucleolar complex protein 2
MAPTKKNLKATKKFEQKHLKGVLEKRKSVQKIKQRQQIKAKKQTKRSRDDEFLKGPKDEKDGATTANGRPKPLKASDMSVDDFFGGGFEILEGKQPQTNKANGKLGKRKREGAVAAAGKDDASEDESESDVPVADEPVEDSDSGSNAGDGDEDPGMSKAAMDALAKDDPEFYKFLQENDPEALEFDEDADLAEIDDLSEGDEEEQPKKKRKKGKESKEDEFLVYNELTREMVARWKKSMDETHSLRATRQVVLAFRAAAHLNEEEEGRKAKYTISSPEVFHDILVVALKKVPEVLQHHVPVKESASGRVYVSTETKKFKTLSILMRSYTGSILHLLGTLSDDPSLKLTLSALSPLLPYLLSFKKLLKALAKRVVAFWCQSASSETTRITAFLVLRRLMVIGDKGIRESVLKAAYQGLISGSRLTSINTIRGINLMKNSAAELWGIDQSIGYTTAFSMIRQLAIHLRNSIVNNKNEAYKAVYNWQYVHSLDFWSCVLAEHCSPLKEAEAGKESQLKLLIYPLVQVTLGAMRLIPTALYFPLRFQLVRSLLRLSRATGTYIPLASALIEVLNSAEMKKSPKQSTLKPLDFSVQYKAPKIYLRTRVYQDGVGEQVFELLSEYFALWSTNIAFPEFALPVVIMLKRWIKEARKVGGTGNRNNKLVSSLVLVVQKIEANAKFIEGKRASVDFAPNNRTQVDAFLKDFEWEKTPIGAYVVGQRKQRAEKAKMMEEARKEDEAKRREEEREKLDGGKGDDGDSEGGEFEEEEDEDEDEMEEEEEEDDEEEEDEEEDEEESE